MLPNLFYIICFSISIIASSVCISIGVAMIAVIISHRQCRTINNMMLCNIAATTILYSILQIISAGFALQKDCLTYQPACFFRAYLYNAVCTAVCVSYTIQSISRLFFTLFYKHRRLLTWRIHWYLISITYVATFILPIPATSIQDGFGFEIESRLCTLSTTTLSSSLLGATTAYVIPITTAILIYTIILSYIRKSTRRIIAHTAANHTLLITRYTQPPNLKREMKLLKNILLLVAIMACAGLPYMILIFWHAVRSHVEVPPPPPSLYLLIMLTITVAFAIKVIIMFYVTKDIRRVAVEYLQKLKLF